VGSNVNGDVLKLTVGGTATGGRPMANVYNYVLGLDEAIDDSALLTAANACATAIYSALKGICHTSCTYTTLDVYNVTQDRNVGTTLISQVGTQSGDALPFGTAALLSADTDKKGRRGRKYLWGVCEDRTVAQVYTGTALVTLIGCAVLWLLGYSWEQGAKALIPVVLDAVDDTYSFFSSVTANAVPAYQRRRRPGS